ncbi:MAG: riboflavin synthase [Pseudomonadota bacterium]|nr:riboflavin synthase [Pseudomonadota bacterium]
MFTGIIQALGHVISLQSGHGTARLSLDPGSLDLSHLQSGDSLAVNGCCLTVLSYRDRRIDMDLSPETLARTTLGSLRPGARVNLEKALALGGLLGGHIVTGHVDGMGAITDCIQDGSTVRLRIGIPDALAKYLSRKGSVAVDGVSLTVNDAAGGAFDVMLIPHTLQATVAAGYRAGMAVNIEVDLIARYVERLMTYTSVQ